MKKIVDNVEVDITAEELKVIEATKTEWQNNALNRALTSLRSERNGLLAETDWWGASDNTMTDAQKKYRQDLRDLTTGLDTVDKVNAVVWPTKP